MIGKLDETQMTVYGTPREILALCYLVIMPGGEVRRSRGREEWEKMGREKEAKTV